ncbi:MAG: hypothetical protein RL711_314 [Bacteroidota bacterium]|jgi:hypothetical protein
MLLFQANGNKYLQFIKQRKLPFVIDEKGKHIISSKQFNRRCGTFTYWGLKN